jgi:hypothetical protein
MVCTITIDQNQLNINMFSTQNEDIIRYFSEIPDEQHCVYLESMILAGVTVFKTVGTTEKVDYIERAFSNLHHCFDGKIDETFGENGSIIKEVFNPDREGTPLYRFKTDINEVLKEIRDKLEAKKTTEDALANTTFKGFGFEDVCEHILETIVRNQQSDILEKTAENPGLLAPSKKGDFVITLGEQPDLKIVFETKDVGTMSIPEIHRQLEESMQNRSAQYGIIVFRFIESVPNSVGWFKEYYGNQLVIALGTREHEEFLASELLHVAYMWAKTKLLQKEARGGTVNIIPIVQEKMKKITDTLKKFSTLRTNCTNLENTVGNIRGLIDTIEQEISDQLLELEKEIGRSTNEERI